MRFSTIVPGKQFGGLARIIALGLGLLPAVLCGFVALSFTASLCIPFTKMFLNHGSTGWGAGLIYLLGVAIAGWLLKRADRCPESTVVWTLIGLGFVAKVLAIWIVPQLPFNTDQALLRHFANKLSVDGYTDATLAALSRFYDYPLWTSRIYPVHYFIACLTPRNALAWTKALNVLAATLILVLTYGISCRVLLPGRRKWAVFLMLILPFQTFWVTDYSHHLYSSLYLLAFAWTAVVLASGSLHFWQRLGSSVLATICLLLLAWQVGVDWIAVGMAVGFVAIHAAISSNIRDTGRLALWLLVIPVTVASALKGPLLLDQLRAADVYRQNSVLPAFMARGWTPTTGGEYCARYEQLDLATPLQKKAKAMFRLVFSQMRHEPMNTCFRLPCIKTAKLFLVGYASNLEESLALAQSPALPWVSWIRRCGTTVFLGFVLIGCFRIAGTRVFHAMWTPVLLVPLLTWGAYVLAGETSPRYSVFCQPFLAIIGACAVQVDVAERHLWPSVRICLVRTVSSAFLLLIVAGIVAMTVRMAPKHIFYEDLRVNWGSASNCNGSIPLFERAIVLKPGEECVSLDWQVPEKTKCCSFYALQCTGTMKDSKVVLESIDGEVLTIVPLTEHTLPQFIDVSLPADMQKLRVRVLRASTDASQEGAFIFGYLLWNMS